MLDVFLFAFGLLSVQPGDLSEKYAAEIAAVRCHYSCILAVELIPLWI